MSELVNAVRRDAAFARALVDFGGGDDDRVDFRGEPTLVDLPEVGDDGEDGNVRELGIGACAQCRVVEQRMN